MSTPTTHGHVIQTSRDQNRLEQCLLIGPGRLMNFDSETLITSFFPRITKKRGIHTELAPSSSSNKRQRGHTARQGTKSKANEDEQERRNTLDKKNGIISILDSPSVESTRQQTSERHMSLLPSLNVKNTTSQTPKPNRSPSRTKRKTPSSFSLQTPPPTNGAAERQRLMELTPILPSSMSRKPLDLRIEKTLLPTPSRSGRSASYHSGHSGNEQSRVNQGQVLLSPTRLKRSDSSLKASVPVSIPSSQSQLMVNAYCEDKHSLMPASTALPCKEQLPQYEVQPSSRNRIILNRRDKGDSTSHDSQMFISSSQSQFLSPLDEHDHPQPSLIASKSEFDIIPSSQSQEKELRILNNLEECHQSIRSRYVSSLNFEIPSDQRLPICLVEKMLCHNGHSQMNCFRFRFCKRIGRTAA